MKKLNTVTVKFADSKYNYSTSVSAESTNDSATAYFVGKSFNLGAYPQEDFQTCIGIEFTDNNKPLFESGATSHAVNDLILYTDNTRELAELRDIIYSDWATHGNFGTTKHLERFERLFNEARKQYCKEFKNASSHILFMTHEDYIEYCTLYANDFANWKKEHELI